MHATTSRSPLAPIFPLTTVQAPRRLCRGLLPAWAVGLAGLSLGLLGGCGTETSEPDERPYSGEESGDPDGSPALPDESGWTDDDGLDPGSGDPSLEPGPPPGASHADPVAAALARRDHGLWGPGPNGTRRYLALFAFEGGLYVWWGDDDVTVEATPSGDYDAGTYRLQFPDAWGGTHTLAPVVDPAPEGGVILALVAPDGSEMWVTMLLQDLVDEPANQALGSFACTPDEGGWGTSQLRLHFGEYGQLQTESWFQADDSFDLGGGGVTDVQDNVYIRQGSQVYLLAPKVEPNGPVWASLQGSQLTFPNGLVCWRQ